MAFQGSDAIILQSGNMFGIVDSGEDDSYPDGSDSRYPWRGGISTRTGLEEQLWDELDALGVRKGNLAFYIGTHAHSDHIGTAAEVIKRYQPQVVYTPRYRDEWITTDAKRWDNRYVYDRLVEATCSVGATLVQTLDPSAPVSPSAPASACGNVPGAAGSPHLTLGDMRIDIVNYKTSYQHDAAIYDANLTAWGVKVTARGHSAFLASDIEEDDEPSVAREVGHVDFLKLGHHGTSTSSSTEFLNVLSPSLAVQTGYVWYLADEPASYLRSHDVEWYPTDEIAAAGSRAVTVVMEPSGLTVQGASSGTTVRRRGWGTPRVTAYRNGRPTALDGWQQFGDEWFWFSNSVDAAQDQWLLQGGKVYYLQDDATMATGWAQDNGTWYYFNADGSLSGSGWLRDNGRWYYLSNGAALTGWQRIDGTWYYFDPDNAWMETGWVDDGSAWYFMAPSGAMRTGWLRSAGRWYYLTGRGAATGWQRVDGTWYYFHPSSAAMATGWVHDGSAWYYLASSGAMRSGWQQIGFRWYYLTGSGAMATGWVSTGNHWYYLSPGSGQMVSGRVVIDGRMSVFAPSGEWLGYAEQSSS